MLEIGLFLRKTAIKKTKYERFHNFSWRLWFLICFAITTSCDWHRQTLNDISSIKNNKQPVLHHLARISFTRPAEFIQLPCRDFTWFINN